MQLSPEQLLSWWHYYYFWLYVIICGIHMSEILHTREMYFKLKWTKKGICQHFGLIGIVYLISISLGFLIFWDMTLACHRHRFTRFYCIFDRFCSCPIFSLPTSWPMKYPNGTPKHFPNSVKFFIIEKLSFMPTSLKAQRLQYSLPFTNSGQRLALLK